MMFFFLKICNITLKGRPVMVESKKMVDIIFSRIPVNRDLSESVRRLVQSTTWQAFTFEADILEIMRVLVMHRGGDERAQGTHMTRSRALINIGQYNTLITKDSINSKIDDSPQIQNGIASPRGTNLLSLHPAGHTHRPVRSQIDYTAAFPCRKTWREKHQTALQISATLPTAHSARVHTIATIRSIWGCLTRSNGLMVIRGMRRSRATGVLGRLMSLARRSSISVWSKGGHAQPRPIIISTLEWHSPSSENGKPFPIPELPTTLILPVQLRYSVHSILPWATMISLAQQGWR